MLFSFAQLLTFHVVNCESAKIEDPTAIRKSRNNKREETGIFVEDILGVDGEKNGIA